MLAAFKNQMRQLKLNLSWYRAEKRGQIDCRIPRQNKGYDHASYGSVEEYTKSFVKDALLRELPALLKICNYREDAAEFSILDYGCGLGRLGYAFTSFFGKDLTREYFGYEVHPESYNFLVKGYQDYPNVHFSSDQILLEESYIELQEKKSISNFQNGPRLRSEEVKLKHHIPKKIDLQFSHSVFTHMLKPSIINVLREVSSVLKSDGVCVNTWLIVDNLAESSMRCGLTDRVLPYEKEGFLTYSQENPLVCSAYRLEMVKEIYNEANHEILDIMWGTWSGRIPSQNFTYQDVIISRPKK